MFSEQTLLERAPELPSTELDGEFVLMSNETGGYYSLAGSATSIWNGLDGLTTVSVLCSSLTAQYEVDEQTCREDVTEFIELLARNNLVRPFED